MSMDMSLFRAPADILILGVGTPEGSPPTDICYIETKSLDGETNLKMRQALESTEEIAAGEGRLHELRGRVMCEHPNRAIDKFSGTFQLQGEVRVTNETTTNAAEKRSLNRSSLLSCRCLCSPLARAHVRFT